MPSAIAILAQARASTALQNHIMEEVPDLKEGTLITVTWCGDDMLVVYTQPSMPWWYPPVWVKPTIASYFLAVFFLASSLLVVQMQLFTLVDTTYTTKAMLLIAMVAVCVAIVAAGCAIGYCYPPGEGATVRVEHVYPFRPNLMANMRPTRLNTLTTNPAVRNRTPSHVIL